jgi:ATP-binding cassette subfamily F protein uup
LNELPGRIEVLEKEQADLQQTMAQADFYKQDKDIVATTLARMEQIAGDLEKCYERWEQLM